MHPGAQSCRQSPATGSGTCGDDCIIHQPAKLLVQFPTTFQTHPKPLGLNIKASTSLCLASSKRTANSLVASSSSDGGVSHLPSATSPSQIPPPSRKTGLDLHIPKLYHLLQEACPDSRPRTESIQLRADSVETFILCNQPRNLSLPQGTLEPAVDGVMWWGVGTPVL